ncbi:MAG: multiheme c-type cytochrome ExtKL [Desulfobacterales bacterium]|jgi:nitrate/TMAO reductase-like tetraheme cytochrome c subunit
MNFLKLLSIILCIALPLPAFAQKAKTIDELSALLDSSRCAECHDVIYAQWEKSQHARPLMGIRGTLNMTLLATPGATPFSPADPKQATLKTYPCFKCHLPQAVDYAEDSVAVEITEAIIAQNREKIAKLQITCIVCHNEKAIIHRLEEGKPDPATLYGINEMDSHEDEVFEKVKKSAVMQHSLMCGQCHGLGPNLEFENPVQCANLYGSYLHAYIPAGGSQTCQECHMKPIDGLADHLMAPNWDDIPQTTKLLQEALSLDVQTLGYEWLEKAKTYVPKVIVNTKVASTAGHRIPDG